MQSLSAIILVTILARIAPLSEADRAMLRSVDDGSDVFVEPALPVLLEHAAQLTLADVDDAADQRGFDWAGVMEMPGAHRGEVFRFAGRVEQVALIEQHGVAAQEWFVRDDSGRPIAVYLPADHASTAAVGERVVVVARFLKVIEDTARDGVARRYPALVGRSFEVQPSGAAGAGPWMPIALLVGIMLVVFVVLSRLARRRRRAALDSPRPIRHELLENEGDPSLPDDPAEALAELKRRAQSSG